MTQTYKEKKSIGKSDSIKNKENNISFPWQFGNNSDHLFSIS